MKRLWTVSPVVLLVAAVSLADVSLTEKSAVRRHPQSKAQNQKKKMRPRPERTADFGSLALVDGSGLQWFINTNITTATFPSSASAAASDATYTHAVQASTSGGGVTSSTLSDAFDGTQALCVSFTGATGPCAFGDPNYVIYTSLGAPPTADPGCAGRQYIFPVLNTNGLAIQRKIYVPAADSFARWIDVFTNTTGAPITFNMITSNNLGSDTNTVIVSSSNGNATAELTDTWLTTFQAFSGGTSNDPRLGHVFQGVGGAIGLSIISFANGSDGPFWGYTITLAAGQTANIVNFAAAQPSKAAAAAKAAQLATLSLGAAACMSPTELSQTLNFNGAAAVAGIPTVSPAALGLLALGLAVAGFLAVRRLA